MDYFSRWPEAEAVKSKSAETVTMFLNKGNGLLNDEANI